MSIQPIRKQVTPEIPDKLYFRIGDVARLCEVPAYVLRFWETEFPQLKPNKAGTGQRLYRKRDVEMALRIKSLLYDQGYTIPGARQVFKNEAKARETVAPEAVPSLPTPVAAGAEAMSPAQPGIAPEEAAATAAAHIRRTAQLQALRRELQAMLTALQKPIRSKERNATAGAQGFRPRLVLEPRPEPKPAPVRLETLRLVSTERESRGQTAVRPMVVE